MKEIIQSRTTILIASIGFIGGIIWAIISKFDPEPIILIFISLIEIISYFLIPKEVNNTQSTDKQNPVHFNNNLGNSPTTNESKLEESNKSKNSALDRNGILDLMGNKISVLFIDDDKNFNVVKILKDSGWKKTQSVIDIKNLDIPAVKNADIIFVDINGVGKILNLENEGLDLSLMLKQKYPEKKVIIYSANRNTNAFHKAWDLCDFKLEKNALPYQFQNLVEEYSIEKFEKQ